MAACLAVAAMSVLGGCGGSTPAGDFQVRGTSVVVNSTAPFTHAPDFPARVESTMAAALAYWGGTWADLRDKTVTFEGEQHVPCAGQVEAIGCYDGSIRVSTRDIGATFSCVEETVLVHEIGHAVIGDPDHRDPRWMDFRSVTSELDGRAGYDDSGQTTCLIFPNVWRHPPPQS